MKAVHIYERGKARIIEVDKPEPKDGHALIRCRRLALCGSDTRWLYYNSDDRYPSKPGATGHEMVGEIMEIYGEAPGFEIGETVLALAPDHGAMQEYYLSKNENMLKIPEGTKIEHALQAQQIGTVIHGAKYLAEVKDKTVAVIGQGSAGLWFNFLIRRRGAKRVIALDLQQHRLMFSERYGASATVHNKEIDAVQAVMDVNEGELADVVVEAAGETSSILLAYDLVKRFGSILFFGIPRTDKMEWPILKHFGKCVDTKSIFGTADEPGHVSTHEALRLIGSGELDVAPVITHHFPFEKVMEAYELHSTYDEGSVKVIVDMEA